MTPKSQVGCAQLVLALHTKGSVFLFAQFPSGGRNPIRPPPGSRRSFICCSFPQWNRGLLEWAGASP